MKNEKCCSQLSMYFNKRHTAFRKADMSFQTKLDSFCKPALLRSKTSSTSESSTDGKKEGFLVSSREMSGYYINLGHGCFLPNPS
jgi:hypothetical protein